MKLPARRFKTPAILGSDQFGILLLAVMAILRGIVLAEDMGIASTIGAHLLIPTHVSVALWFGVGAIGGLSFLIPELKRYFIFLIVFIHFLWGVLHLESWSDGEGTRGAGALLLYWSVAALILWGFSRAHALPVEDNDVGKEP